MSLTSIRSPKHTTHTKTNSRFKKAVKNFYPSVLFRPVLTPGLHNNNVQVFSLLWASHKPSEDVYQGDKVQQVHPRLVGLGVSQWQEWRQLETHSVACIASLTARGTKRSEKSSKFFSQLTKFYENNKSTTGIFNENRPAEVAMTIQALADFGVSQFQQQRGLTAFMMFPACSTRCRMAWSSSQLISSTTPENMNWTQPKNLEREPSQAAVSLISFFFNLKGFLHLLWILTLAWQRANVECFWEFCLMLCFNLSNAVSCCNAVKRSHFWEGRLKENSKKFKRQVWLSRREAVRLQSFVCFTNCNFSLLYVAN